MAAVRPGMVRLSAYDQGDYRIPNDHACNRKSRVIRTMKPAHCPHCQSDQLTGIDMRGEFWFAPFRLAKTLHVACLDCGIVTGYLDDATTAMLRARRAKSINVKATKDEL